MGSGPSAASHPNEVQARQDSADSASAPSRMSSRKSLSLAQVYHFRVGEGSAAHTASLFQSLLNAPDPGLFLGQLEGLEKSDKVSCCGHPARSLAAVRNAGWTTQGRGTH